MTYRCSEAAGNTAGKSCHTLPCADALRTLCTLFLHPRKEAADCCFLCSPRRLRRFVTTLHRWADLGWCSGENSDVRTMTNRCNVGMVVPLLCGGSIRQMLNIWSGTLHDSSGASSCCHAASSQNTGVFNTVPECEITLGSERCSSPSHRGPAAPSG